MIPDAAYDEIVSVLVAEAERIQRDEAPAEAGTA